MNAVETVLVIFAVLITGLKPGVNEGKPSDFLPKSSFGLPFTLAIE